MLHYLFDKLFSVFIWFGVWVFLVTFSIEQVEREEVR